VFNVVRKNLSRYRTLSMVEITVLLDGRMGREQAVGLLESVESKLWE
jgi:hypothetical protein